GQTWQKISPDLTLADPQTLGKSGGRITMDMNGPEIYGTVFALAPSHFDVNTIWAGSDDGLVHVTRDGGKTWQDVTPPDMAKYTRVSLIDASPHDPATAYVAGKRFQLDDRAPYIWRTHDYGRTWTKIVNGIAPNDFVHAVREDPVRPHLLYAGTEHGVYVSFDDGDHWQSLSLDLPDTKVADLIVEKHDLVAGTHGRSIYVLDDIDPLRQLTPDIASGPAHLFNPHAATRGVTDGVIQYWLAHPADSVEVTILDGKGDVVRRFTGTPADTARPEQQSYYRRAPRAPTVHAGLNRFEWDLRYPGATTFEGMIIWSARPQSGPVAPPGTYTVRLTANGVTETQPLQVRMDPRLKGVTPADLEEQFALASKIRDATSAANQAVIDIRALRKALDAATDSAKAHGANARAMRSLERAAQPLLDGTRQIEEALYQTKNRSGQDPLNFPIKLNNRLAALRRSVETGDATPTAGAYRVFKQLKAQLDGHLLDLERVVHDRLPAVNRALQQAGGKPLTWQGK
ncbi:MAG TPA: hypothetical protein VJ957_12475, partial [Longimicrobiales bacterium]|nr:hypothetical protein [Longimicrobiales bacterium]